MPLARTRAAIPSIAAGALALALSFASPAALAQQAQPSATDLNAAAQAFEQGQRAQISQDYARAAELFEIAYRSAPSAPALRSAIRNHRAAGHNARAATLALRARAAYGADATTTQLADTTIAELSPQLGRLHLRCSVACNLAVDGQAANLQGPVSEYEGFVDPGAHTINATWSDRAAVSREFTATANQPNEISIDAPEPTPSSTPEPAAPATTPAPAVTVTPAPPPQPAPRASGLPPAVVGVGAGLTVVSAIVLIWSGVDTLQAADVYRMTPTEDRYNDGVGRETRTNVAIAVTSVLGVATIATALFATNWNGGGGETHARRPRIRAIPTFVSDGSRVGVGLLGSF